MPRAAPVGCRHVCLAFVLPFFCCGSEVDGGRDDGGPPVPATSLDVAAAQPKHAQVSTATAGGDTFVYDFSCTGFPNLRMTYRNASEATSTTFRVGLAEVAELDRDQNGAFNSSSSVRLAGEGRMWKDVVQERRDDAGVRLSTTLVLDGGMNVTFEFSVLRAAANRAKFSVYVNGFPYVFAESELAFILMVTSSQINKADERDGAIYLGGGALTWDDWVLADGARTVLSAGKLGEGHTYTYDVRDDQAMTGEGSKFVAFAEVDGGQARSVVWDPVLTTSGGAGQLLNSPQQKVEGGGANLTILWVALVVTGLFTACGCVLLRKESKSKHSWKPVDVELDTMLGLY